MEALGASEVLRKPYILVFRGLQIDSEAPMWASEDFRGTRGPMGASKGFRKRKGASKSLRGPQSSLAGL